jgi:hypothetical protein
MMRTIQLAAACVAVLVATAGQVQAGIITNGDFELGLTGWTVTGGSSLNGIATTGSPTGNQDSRILTHFPASPTGDKFAYQTWNSANTYQLTQNFIAPSATTFTLSFDVLWDFTGGSGWNTSGNLANSGQTLVVDIVRDGTPFANRSAANVVVTALTVGANGEAFDSQGWQSYSVDVSAELAPLAGETLTLRYIGAVWNNWSTYAIDNIELEVQQTSAVPEPSSLVVFGIGLCIAGVGTAYRRRREKQQATS